MTSIVKDLVKVFALNKISVFSDMKNKVSG